MNDLMENQIRNQRAASWLGEAAQRIAIEGASPF